MKVPSGTPWEDAPPSNFDGSPWRQKVIAPLNMKTLLDDTNKYKDAHDGLCR